MEWVLKGISVPELKTLTTDIYCLAEVKTRHGFKINYKIVDVNFKGQNLWTVGMIWKIAIIMA